MSRSRLWAVICIALLGVCAPAQSRAELASETQILVDQGMDAVRDKEWGLGIKYFKEAVAQAPTEPALLFNLALVYDKAVKPLGAALYYRAYLALEPDGQNAERVRKRIGELDAKIGYDALKLIRKSREIIDSLPRKASDDDLLIDSHYGWIVRSLIRLGELEAAGDAADAVIGMAMRMHGYEALIEAYSAAGKDVEAYATMVKAVDLKLKYYFKDRKLPAVSVTGYDETAFIKELNTQKMLIVGARGKIARGDIQGAIDFLAQAGETGGGSSEVYAKVAERQTEQGDIAGALKTLSLLQDRESEALALYRISRRQSADGHIQAALETIRQAEAVAAQVTSADAKRRLALASAISHVAVGNVAEAIRARDTISEKDSARDEADIAIAAALARSGAVAEARQRASAIGTEAARFNAYRDMAYEQARAGDIAGAESTIALISDPRMALQARGRVAEARGSLRQAHSLALQDVAYDHLFFVRYDEWTEAGKRLDADAPKSVVTNFVYRAGLSINALVDMRATDAKWKNQVSPGKPGL